MFVFFQLSLKNSLFRFKDHLCFMTWPSQQSHLCLSSVCGWYSSSGTYLCVGDLVFPCYVEGHCKFLVWKVFNFCSSIDSMPKVSVLMANAQYTVILIFKVSFLLSLTLWEGLDMVVPAKPIHLPFFFQEDVLGDCGGSKG